MAAYLGQTSFLSGQNATFIAELYQRYIDDPGAIDESWAEFFRTLDDDGRSILDELKGATWAPKDGTVLNAREAFNSAPPLDDRGDGQAVIMVPPGYAPAGYAPQASGEAVRRAALDSIRAFMMIRAFRIRGHLQAQLDPLGIEQPTHHADLDPETYGFGPKDMDRPIFINYALGMESATPRQILRVLKETYCHHIGVEYMHIPEPEKRIWIQERIEAIRNQTQFTERGKIAILERLTQAEGFEKFLDKKFTGTKRFGLDGGESLVPAIEQMIKRGGQLGVREIVIGMAHRGRLNVLANVMGKPYQAIFSEFQGGSSSPDDVHGSGDVKYHLGTSSDRIFDGISVHLSLTANPSHLEVVDPVVLGKVRAKQRQRGDSDGAQVLGLLFHGDAAFAGQGIVGECFDFSELKGYQTGGTIHVVINNQIGFTTSPRFSRSSPYCSDVAKRVGAPIFHVNADDPEAVVHVARIATEFRQKFREDAVVDMICYRRHGHNEGDEPRFTQPLMYSRIENHGTTRTLYARQLEQEGVLPAGGGDELLARFNQELDRAFEAAKGFKANKADWLEGKWAGLELGDASDPNRGDTAVAMETLKEVGFAISEPPSNFNVNSKILRVLRGRRQMIETGDGIDWATAEALAFGTLLVESVPVRLSGQDCGRGTFSQRHSVIVDQDTEERYLTLNHIRYGQAPFEVIDSPLSEAGVLGFEYGYSLAEPHALVLWEAQFGDFANGAQVVIDQFVSSGELKWLRMSGLVMLLPHGYEGQGPEHSSARLERYLQLCAEDNLQVCNITRPANYFHALRRQMRRSFRKPLIIMSPKSLLRHKKAVSRLEEFATGTTFHRVVWDDHFEGEDGDVDRVVLCSGKVYFDLVDGRAQMAAVDRKKIYILRVEQLYPWPVDALRSEMSRFNDPTVVWCQEEPENMGSWFFVDRRLEALCKDLGFARHDRPIYAGRAPAASPATGLAKRHADEQNRLVAVALGLA